MEKCILPRELLIEILARLPVKSLMRFKSVCKFLYCLIKSDNHFQHKHYEISRRVRRDYVIFEREIGIREFPLWRERVFGLVYKELDCDEEIECVDLVMPSSCIRSVRCIDGMLCVIAHRTDGNMDILIWNPSTREIKALPPISPPHNFPPDQLEEVIGFGFCNNMTTTTGKVVIVWSLLGGSGCEYKVMVCSQVVGNLWGWREINQYPHLGSLWGSTFYDIYLNGKYYWNFYAYPDPGDKIKLYLVWFDMSAEIFGTISLPSNPPAEFGNGGGGEGFPSAMVSVMNDTIALIGYREDRLEVWLMMENDYSDAANWQKYACIDRGDDFLQPMRIWNQDRDLLVCRMGAEEDDREPHLVSIDLLTGKKKRIDNIKTHSNKCFLAYSESLKMF